jgi:hypothetical protein
MESRHETLKCTEWYLVVTAEMIKQPRRKDGAEKKRKGPEKGCVGNGR